VKMTMTKPAETIENLKYSIDSRGATGTLTLAWEDHIATYPSPCMRHGSILRITAGGVSAIQLPPADTIACEPFAL